MICAELMSRVLEVSRPTSVLMDVIYFPVVIVGRGNSVWVFFILFCIDSENFHIFQELRYRSCRLLVASVSLPRTPVNLAAYLLRNALFCLCHKQK